MNVAQRKQHHIQQALRQQGPDGRMHPFDEIRLTHNALPEVSYHSIDLSSQLAGCPVHSPLFVSAMTGGIEWANQINQSLAEACREMGWAMGVGSQRIQLEEDSHEGFRALRRWIGSGVVFANFGAVNLPTLKQVSELDRILEPLQANALVLHLNPMQEVFQVGGDLNWQGVSDRIAATCEYLSIPVIVKEVGFGLSSEAAGRLLNLGVAAIDVAGRGGTRFDDIEASANPARAADARVFADWGQTTVECLRSLQGFALPVWASGGLRNGLDAAKAMALGAVGCGFAGRLLEPATRSTAAVIEQMQQLDQELRTACYGLGVARVTDIGRSHLWETLK